MSRKQNKNSIRPQRVVKPSSHKGRVVAILAGISWTWAAALLATRHHLTGDYGVIQGAPQLWGLVVLPLPLLALLLAWGAGVAGLCLVVARGNCLAIPVPTRWVLATSLVPALDLLRLGGVEVPATVLEPLLVAGMTGMAAGGFARTVEAPPGTLRRMPSVLWPLTAWLVTILCGIWWYRQSVDAYNGFLLGFNDFGHFGFRVANTWEGRGFLLETLSLPPFWDHFNPGLALLAPLWGLWPDPKLFLLVQSLCLALPAPIVYATARHLKATGVEATMWSAAYLTFPVTSQLNLNYTYGWHPVSLAIPLLFLSLLCLLRRQWTGALAAAVLASSFQEDVVVTLGCLAAALALQGWWSCRSRRDRDTSASGACILTDCLPPWAWGTILAVLIVAFGLMYVWAGFARFQVSRFEALGDSGLEVALSPVLRPAKFWGTVLRLRSAWFLLALLVPLGLPSLFRGRWILLTCTLPLGVLLAWDHVPATSIAFQYTSSLIPVLFLSAIIGSTVGEKRPGGGSRSPMLQAAATALAGCFAASLWLGALPWSGNTLTDVIGHTYAGSGEPACLEDRMAGTRGIAVLHDVVAQVRRRDASVLATGRIAAHLLAVERVDTVGQARGRWAAFEAEAGPGRSGIELFDWVVVDICERFQQSEEDIRFVLGQANKANYALIRSECGIILLGRPED